MFLKTYPINIFLWVHKFDFLTFQFLSSIDCVPNVSQSLYNTQETEIH